MIFIIMAGAFLLKMEPDAVVLENTDFLSATNEC